MHRVAEGLHGRGHLRGNAVADRPHIGERNRHRRCERAVDVDPEYPRVLTHMEITAAALVAVPAYDV